jgi:hypothetical protein
MEERECEYAGKCAIPCSKVIELGNLMASMQTTLDQVHEDLYNHGKEGMKTVLQTFIAEYKQGERDRKEFQESRDKETKDRLDRATARQNFRLNTIIAVCAILTVVVAFLALRQSGFKASFSTPPGISYEQPSQDAGAHPAGP